MSNRDVRHLLGSTVTVETGRGAVHGTLLSCTSSSLWLVDDTEDDVMVAVVARPGTSLDPVDLIAFCRERMARHMVPRYVDVIDELPRTPTEKVEKAVLRARGVTPITWDAEAAARS